MPTHRQECQSEGSSGSVATQVLVVDLAAFKMNELCTAEVLACIADRVAGDSRTCQLRTRNDLSSSWKAR